MSNDKYIADIQALRALAVAFVLIHHSGALFIGMQEHRVQFGMYAGVDLFFCISGFVITSSLFSSVSAAGDRKQAFRGFWKSRFWRLIPSMLLWLGLMLWKTAEFSSGTRLVETAGDALAALFQVMNLRSYLCKTGMASCGDGAIFWTLSLEFQFYLLVSLLVFFVSRKWLMIILFLALIFQMAIPHNHWQNLLSFLRTDAFICGVMIAFIKIYCPDLYCRAEPRFLRWRAVGIIVTGVMGAGLILSGNHEYFPWEYRTQSVTLFAACLVWYASYNKNYIACFDRVRPALLWLGSRSYALYLSHPFVWGVVWWYFREMKPCLPEAIYFIGLLIVGLGVLFLIAELNYRLIEVWLRKQGVMYCARRKPGFA